MRRLDMEDMLGYVPQPNIGSGKYLVDILFQVGPVMGESPLHEGALEPWERRRGIELAPWQAEAVVLMSQAYMTEMHAAKEPAARPPWEPAAPIWRWITGKRAEQAAEQGRKARRASEKPKE